MKNNCPKTPFDVVLGCLKIKHFSPRFATRVPLRAKLLFSAFLLAGFVLSGSAQSSNRLETQNGLSLSGVSADCSDPSSSLCSSQSDTSLDSLTPETEFGSSRSAGLGAGRAYSDLENLTRPQSSSRNTERMAQRPIPEPLTEFQRFMAATTGQVLPIYGASLFERVPTTFAPLDLSPVPADFRVGPGDELRIRVWGQVNFQSNLRVDRAGEIFLPQIGPVHVSGLPFSQLDEQLHAAIGRIYRNFNLTVGLGQIRSIQVYVTGQARRPGVYTISALSTLVDALFASGGPALHGSLRTIELRRGNRLEAQFDLYDLLQRGDKSKDVHLESGDVIFIPPVGAQAAVTGSIRIPAIYEIKPGEPLSALLAYAGGATSVAAQARISIERVDGHRDRSAMEVGYDEKGLATPVADGDLVRVFAIVPLYRNTVTLRGNTANPGRFGWHSGMHLSELIPDQESLLTRNYWWHRTQLGLDALEFEPVPGFSTYRQPAGNQPVTLERAPSSGNPDETALAMTSPQNPSDNQTAPTRNQTAFQQSQQPLNASQRNGSVSLAGAGQNNQALLPAQRTEVRNLAPEINWDYAVIERLDPQTLKTNLVPFDLGKLVREHDRTQDLELHAGDIVTIFSAADIRIPIAHQNKTVTLEGEFAHAGAYTVEPGETLRQLVTRVGGLSPNAYLYGSEFTRKSTRAIQQARIDEYVQSLSMSIQRGNLALAASAVGSSQQDASSASAAQQSQQQLLANLKQIRATGRIVLELKPSASGLDSLPELALEDGDRFIVPSMPSNVNVVGAVYDQNSFLYNKSRHVGDYLKLSGGPTRDADHKHTFIIRADGEVVSRDRNSDLFGTNFAKLRMYPGDTIVVPDKSLRPTALREFLQWSQMFSQLALGAAAISVLQ